MIIFTTPEFQRWLKNLKDLKAKAKILVRLERIRMYDHFGDSKSLGSGLSELRISEGKGYRLYFTQKDREAITFLGGGDKKTQSKDIKRCYKLIRTIT